jgi:2-polyprenyl-3-methyl-5-hydroxy-6-metoxy-1,4-benzoquinol methylase
MGSTSANFNPSYVSDRPDIERLIDSNTKSVLDVGCSIGKLGGAIKKKTGAYVIGIEISEKMGKIAKLHLDDVFIGDATNILLGDKLKKHTFDTIIFADILEHIIDPWTTLKSATQLLTKDGYIIVSIPNVRFIATIFNLIFKGSWPYRTRGIHDKTHLRFFTFNNINNMFNKAGLKIIKIKRNYRFIDKPHPINNLAKYIALPIIKEFLTYQYLLVGNRDNLK